MSLVKFILGAAWFVGGLYVALAFGAFVADNAMRFSAIQLH